MNAPEKREPESRELQERDVAGIVGCLVAVAIGIAAIATSGDFSPLGSVFPRAIAGLMVVLGLAYIGLSLRGPRPAVVSSAATSVAAGAPDAGIAPPVSPQVVPSTPRRLAAMAVMLAWAFLLTQLGFLSTSFVACFALLLIAQYDRWTPRRAVVCGLAVAAVLGVLYAVFKLVLQVPLPVGIFI